MSSHIESQHHCHAAARIGDGPAVAESRVRPNGNACLIGTTTERIFSIFDYAVLSPLDETRFAWWQVKVDVQRDQQGIVCDGMTKCGYDTQGPTQ